MMGKRSVIEEESLGRIIKLPRLKKLHILRKHLITLLAVYPIKMRNQMRSHLRKKFRAKIVETMSKIFKNMKVM